MEVVVYPHIMQQVVSLIEKLAEWDEIAPDIRIFNRIELIDEGMATVGWVTYEPFEQWVFIPHPGEPT